MIITRRSIRQEITGFLPGVKNAPKNKDETFGHPLRAANVSHGIMYEAVTE
jgi:hypothetical protein